MNKTEVYFLAIVLAKKYPNRLFKSDWTKDDLVQDLDWFDMLQIKQRVDLNRQLIHENRISEL